MRFSNTASIFLYSFPIYNPFIDKRSVGYYCTAYSLLHFAFSRLSLSLFSLYYIPFYQSSSGDNIIRCTWSFSSDHYRAKLQTPCEGVFIGLYSTLRRRSFVYVLHLASHSRFLRHRKSMVVIYPSQYPKRVVFVFQFKNYPFGVYFIRRLQLWCNDP